MDNLRTQNVLLTCKKCQNRWLYRGKNPYFATCTFCLRKVVVPKKGIKEKIKKFVGV